MTRKIYDEQLIKLKQLLAETGELNVRAIYSVVERLKGEKSEKNKKAENVLYDSVAFIKNVKKFESAVDENEGKIERLCLKLIVRQQPVASDLLFITSAMKMITDMERIADQAVDISELAIKADKITQGEIFDDLQKAADAVCEMVKGIMQAFIENDIEKADKICRADDFVDDCFLKIKGELTAFMAKNKNQDDNERALDMLMIAKYLERIGDHAVNIAEWIIFSLTGSHKKLD